VPAPDQTRSNIASLFPTVTPSPAATSAGHVRHGAYRQNKALMNAEPPGNSLGRLIFLAAVAACTIAATVAWLSLDKIRKRRIL
jgi:hypothetical protein